MHQQVLCIALEKIINQALTMNLNRQKTPASLDNKTLIVSLQELGFPLCFTYQNNNVLMRSGEITADDNHCVINTSFASLKLLKEEQQLTKLIKEDKLDIDGNIKIAQQFAAIAEQLDIDWQGELEKHIGDVATYKLSSLFSTIKSKLDFAREQIQADASEYIVHEKRLVVTASQVNNFNLSVINTADRVDELAARIDQLTQKIDSQ